MERVVITGIGTVSPIGNNTVEFWENIKNDQHGIGPITKFDASATGISVAAEVKNFNGKELLGNKEVRRMDYFSQYGLVAAMEAVEMSGYDIAANPMRVGTLVSSGIGGLVEIENGIRKMIEKGPKRIPPLFVPLTIGNMVAGNISMKLAAKGISLDIVSACASATNAIGEAFLKIKMGLLDACIAGGSEGTINEIGIGGFAALTALSTESNPDLASRPFDKDRDGFVMGEGAGILFLESLSSAQKRGATILGEVVGYGSTSDAYHMTAPSEDGSGAGEAMKMAIQQADIEATQIDYINAHGTSTPTNDSAETVAIKYALGEHAYQVPISSSKGFFGHLLGAAGGVEAIVTVKALAEGFIPATLGLQNPEDVCDLDYVPHKGRSKAIHYALSNSLGFGGHNAVLCFKRWEGNE